MHILSSLPQGKSFSVCLLVGWFYLIWIKVKYLPCYGVLLHSTVATSCMCLSKLKLIKIKYIQKFCSSIALAMFQVLNNHLWPVATELNSAGVEYLHHQKKFCQTAPL